MAMRFVFLFRSGFHVPMPLLPRLFQPVPDDEATEVIAEAIAQPSHGLPRAAFC